MRSGLLLAASMALAAAQGCAGPAPYCLVDARAALAHARLRPTSALAKGELAEAEEAIADAERAAAASPGSAQAADATYVALRLSQRAEVAGLHAGAHDELLRLRASVARLRDRLAARATTERAVHDAERLRAARHEARRSRLEAAVGPIGLVLEEGGATLVRLPPEALFLAGTSLLRDGAAPLLARIAAVLAAAPGCRLRIQVLDDVEGVHVDGPTLARRRIDRLLAELARAGVPTDAIGPPERHRKPGAQVDFRLTEESTPPP